ncbi:MAG: hypothetical protein ABIZ64_02775 [Casimicrobium sp.]
MKSANKMILLVALVCAAPFVSAWVAYYFIKPQGGGSYGQLLETRPLAPLALSAADAEKWGGKWRLVMAIGDECDAECQETLHSTRQARTMLGRERERLIRVVIASKSLDPALLAEHPDLVVFSTPTTLPDAWQSLLKRGVFLVDPIGNQVIMWPKNPDIKKLNSDLSRLLRASRIG